MGPTIDRPTERERDVVDRLERHAADALARDDRRPGDRWLARLCEAKAIEVERDGVPDDPRTRLLLPSEYVRRRFGGPAAEVTGR